MSPLLARMRARWSVVRVRSPRGAAAVEDALVAARGRRRLVAEVRDLRVRLRGLERDHLLLAAHVSVLTERAAAGADIADPEGAALRRRAGLTAIAHYEERIGRLERLVRPRDRAGRARSAGGGMTIGRTSGEPGGSAS